MLRGSASHLVFAPQQIVVLIGDTGADKVHAMVLNSEVEISEPEHQPRGRGRKRKQLMHI